MRRLWITGAALALVGTVALVALHPRRTAGSPTERSTARPTTVQQVSVSIPVSDGVRLAGYLSTPTRGTGRPLLIMPGAWGAGSDQYRSISDRAVSLGYDVVAYTQRGFGGSGGLIDMAGSRTQVDVSDVISWALPRTGADSSRVGALGLSYGGGIALLAAARDSRIRAVVAMSTWADLADVFAPRGTVKSSDLALLLANRAVAPELRTLQANVGNLSTARAALTGLSPSRSPSSVVAELNRNGTAIFIANAYEDSLFQPSDVVSFFNTLTGPKRLLLGSGDHVAPLTPAYASSSWWTMAFSWLDSYAGRSGSVSGAPVQLTDATTGRTHAYGSWPPAKDSVQLSLAASRTEPVTVGLASVADSGTQQLNTAHNYVLPQVRVASVDTRAATLWSASSEHAARSVCGTPSVQFTVHSSAAVTLYIYLYDVDAGGTGQLMTTAPYTVKAGVQSVGVPLEPICWTIPAGHHVSAIVDTFDNRYVGTTPPAATVTLSPTAQLTVPDG